MVHEQRAVDAQTAPRYRKAGKKQKAKILDEFIEDTGYHRKYANRVLRK